MIKVNNNFCLVEIFHEDGRSGYSWRVGLKHQARECGMSCNKQKMLFLRHKLVSFSSDSYCLLWILMKKMRNNVLSSIIVLQNNFFIQPLNLTWSNITQSDDMNIILLIKLQNMNLIRLKISRFFVWKLQLFQKFIVFIFIWLI